MADRIVEPFCYGCAGFVLSYRVARSIPAKLLFIGITILCFLWMDDIWPAIGSRSARMAMASENHTVADMFAERQQVGLAQFDSGERSGLWDIFKLDAWDIGSAVVFVSLGFFLGVALTRRRKKPLYPQRQKPPPPPGTGRSRPPPPPDGEVQTGSNEAHTEHAMGFVAKPQPTARVDAQSRASKKGPHLTFVLFQVCVAFVYWIGSGRAFVDKWPGLTGIPFGILFSSAITAVIIFGFAACVLWPVVFAIMKVTGRGSIYTAYAVVVMLSLIMAGLDITKTFPVISGTKGMGPWDGLQQSAAVQPDVNTTE